MPARSLSSSVLKWPDQTAVDQAVRRWAAQQVDRRPAAAAVTPQVTVGLCCPIGLFQYLKGRLIGHDNVALQERIVHEINQRLD